MPRMPLTLPPNSLTKWRTPLAVGLAILLVAVTAWIVWCEIGAARSVTETFKSNTKTPPHEEDVSPFQAGAEVYIRRGQAFCFYRGTILRLHLNPKTNRPYTTPTRKNYKRDGLLVVQYTPGLDQSPNGGEMWEEIPVREVYAYPGNTGASRSVCRVFLVDNPPLRWWEQTNTGYVTDTQKYSGANSVQETLMCRPAKYMNMDFVNEVPVPAAKRPPAQNTRLGKPEVPAAMSGLADKEQTAFDERRGDMEFAGTGALASAKERSTRLSQDEGSSLQDTLSSAKGNADGLQTPTSSSLESSLRDKTAGSSINTGAATDKLAEVSNETKAAGANTDAATDKLTAFSNQAKEAGANAKEQVHATYKQTKHKVQAAFAGSVTAPKDFVKMLYGIMDTLWKNTYVDVRLGLVNAAPSVTSDTYHKPVRKGHRHRLYYNTSNGCVSPRLSKISPQSAALGVHPAACSGTTYELEYGAVSEIHMVGSDEGGHALLMFPQLVSSMRSELQKVMGVSPGMVRGFVSSMNMALFYYYPLRKYVRAQTLTTRLKATRPPDGKANPTAQVQTQLQKILAALRVLIQSVGKGHTDMTYLTPPRSQLYKQTGNRLLPMFATRARHMASSDEASRNATMSPAVFCCEHDAVLSVGYGNADCAAGMTMAAYNNAPYSRLMTGGDMTLTTTGMLSAAFGETVETNVLGRDQVFLRELLGIFLGPFANALLAELRKAATQANEGALASGGREAAAKEASRKAQAAAKTSSFVAVVRQLLTETAVQLAALVGKMAPAEIAQMALFRQWADVGTDTADSKVRSARIKAAQLFVDALANTPQPGGITPNSSGPLPEVTSHVVVVDDIPQANQPKKLTVHLPWKSSVFGVEAAVGEALRNHVSVKVVEVTSRPDRQSVALVVTRTSAPPNARNVGPMRIYLTKRLTVEQLTPQTWLPRMLLGYHTTAEPAHVADSLTRLPVYSIPYSPVTSATGFHSGNVYESKDGTCYMVRCPNVYEPNDQPNACCPGVSDVSACSYATPLQQCPTGGGSQDVSPKEAVCHGAAFDISTCTPAFRQMLQNARNATLILDAEAVPQLMDFLDFSTNPTMASLHVAALHRTVKTLVLTTSIFHDLALELQAHANTKAKGNVSLPKITSPEDRISKLDRTLRTLTILYGIVAVVAPPAMCDTGGMLSKIDELRTTVSMEIDEPCKTCDAAQPPKAPKCKQIKHKVTKVAYQMYKTLTLTFRRRFDNSEDWSANQTSLHDLQRMNSQEAVRRAKASQYAQKHHKAADFRSSPDIMHTILSYSCPPEMVATIRGITWYGREPIVQEVEGDNPLAVSLLPACESKQ